MPLICVPPGNTSPNQKGAGAVVNCASLKLTWRHAVTGTEASFVPRCHRQLAPRPNITAAWVEKEKTTDAKSITEYVLRIDSCDGGVWRAYRVRAQGCA